MYIKPRRIWMGVGHSLISLIWIGAVVLTLYAAWSAVTSQSSQAVYYSGESKSFWSGLSQDLIDLVPAYRKFPKELIWIIEGLGVVVILGCTLGSLCNVFHFLLGKLPVRGWKSLLAVCYDNLMLYLLASWIIIGFAGWVMLIFPAGETYGLTLGERWDTEDSVLSGIILVMAAMFWLGLHPE